VEWSKGGGPAHCGATRMSRGGFWHELMGATGIRAAVVGD
jgi:hypothetical protein